MMLSGAQDVEIRSHLDLRSLPAVHNSAILGVETEDHPKRFALLYTSPPFRSMRVRLHFTLERLRVASGVPAWDSLCVEHLTGSGSGHCMAEHLLNLKSTNM